MYIVIIEDEDLHYNRLIRIISQLPGDIHILGRISSVKEGLLFFETNKENIDLIISDVNLGDGDCFEIFRNIDLNVPIIFTTAFDKYLTDSFKLLTIDYLLKPFKKEQLQGSLEKFGILNLPSTADLQKLFKDLSAISSEAKKTYRERILITVGTKMEYIKVADIAYFVASGAGIDLVTENEKYPLEKPISEIETIMDPQKFFRVNQNYLVNITSVIRIEKYFDGEFLVELNPRPQKDVVVSKTTAADLKNWLGNIL